jgi:hypothetical protein
MWTVILLIGCSESHDLATRQARQAELQHSLAVLQADFEDVNRDFETVSGAGALRRPDPGAKPVRKIGKRWLGHQAPRHVLDAAAIRVVVQRTGVPTPLPELEAPARADGPCGWSFTLPRLRPLSDLVLRNSGLGRSSPLVLTEDGAPLTPHADGPDVGDRCVGAFRHAGAAVQFSPSGHSEAATQRRYTLTADPSVPLPRGDDGRPLYWVYPGTQLEFTIIDAWDPAWGDPTITLGAKLVGEHTGRPILELHDQPQLLDEDAPVVEHVVRPLDLDGNWALRLSSPTDGPWVAIDTLTIGNSEYAMVVTGERAWETR